MNHIDEVAPGEAYRWQIVGGKVKRIEETIPIALVVEKEEIEKVEEELKKVYGKVQVVPENEELKPQEVDIEEVKKLQKKKGGKKTDAKKI